MDVAGRVCLDIGASTGGFTEVLVARGARRVYAVDVGTVSFIGRLRGRPDIVSMEGTDIRTLDPSRFAERPDIVTIDVSFISLKLVLPAALALATRPAKLLALIKPQFEAAAPRIRNGIVRDAASTKRSAPILRSSPQRSDAPALRYSFADHRRRRQSRVLPRRRA